MVLMPIPAGMEAATRILPKADMLLPVMAEPLEADMEDLTMLQLQHLEIPTEELVASIW